MLRKKNVWNLYEPWILWNKAAMKNCQIFSVSWYCLMTCGYVCVYACIHAFVFVYVCIALSSTYVVYCCGARIQHTCYIRHGSAWVRVCKCVDVFAIRMCWIYDIVTQHIIHPCYFTRTHTSTCVGIEKVLLLLPPLLLQHNRLHICCYYYFLLILLLLLVLPARSRCIRLLRLRMICYATYVHNYRIHLWQHNEIQCKLIFFIGISYKCLNFAEFLETKKAIMVHKKSRKNRKKFSSEISIQFSTESNEMFELE